MFDMIILVCAQKICMDLFLSPSLQASVVADKVLDDLSQANEELRVDIDKWKESKDREVNRLMRKVADDHVDFHQKVRSP